jgi:hypothetical protein
VQGSTDARWVERRIRAPYFADVSKAAALVRRSEDGLRLPETDTPALLLLGGGTVYRVAVDGAPVPTTTPALVTEAPQGEAQITVNTGWSDSVSFTRHLHDGLNIVSIPEAVSQEPPEDTRPAFYEIRYDDEGGADLDWSPVRGAARYEVQVDTPGEFRYSQLVETHRTRRSRLDLRRAIDEFANLEARIAPVNHLGNLGRWSRLRPLNDAVFVPEDERVSDREMARRSDDEAGGGQPGRGNDPLSVWSQSGPSGARRAWLFPLGLGYYVEPARSEDTFVPDRVSVSAGVYGHLGGGYHLGVNVTAGLRLSDFSDGMLLPVISLLREPIPGGFHQVFGFIALPDESADGAGFISALELGLGYSRWSLRTTAGIRVRGLDDVRVGVLNVSIGYLF